MIDRAGYWLLGGECRQEYNWAGGRGTAASWALSGIYTGTAGQGREVQQLPGHSPVYIQVRLGTGQGGEVQQLPGHSPVYIHYTGTARQGGEVQQLPGYSPL